MFKTLLTGGCALALAASLSACQSFDIGKLAEAVNTADQSPCYKDLDIKVTPMLLFGWYVPIISGGFRKVCNGDKAPPAGSAPPTTPSLAIGALVAPASPALPVAH